MKSIDLVNTCFFQWPLTRAAIWNCVLLFGTFSETVSSYSVVRVLFGEAFQSRAHILSGVSSENKYLEEHDLTFPPCISDISHWNVLHSADHSRLYRWNWDVREELFCLGSCWISCQAARKLVHSCNESQPPPVSQLQGMHWYNYRSWTNMVHNMHISIQIHLFYLFFKETYIKANMWFSIWDDFFQFWWLPSPHMNFPP